MTVSCRRCALNAGAFVCATTRRLLPSATGGRQRVHRPVAADFSSISGSGGSSSSGARTSFKQSQGLTKDKGHTCSSSNRDSDSREFDDDRISIRAPLTTYEGHDDDNCGSWLNRLTKCSGSFLRSTFVKEGRPCQELEQKYDIGEEIGQGATATVYRAINRRTGQAVALKAICKNRISDQQMLQNEIQIHKATDHPNILRLLEIFEDEQKLFLVTELCEAGDLWRLMASNSEEFSAINVSEEDALQLLNQILNSVVYLHSRGIVHRDLKPGNFLCQLLTPLPKTADADAPATSAPRILKLADFGVSSYCHVKHRLTRKVGTDGFMAPEIIRNQPYDEKADIFSIGCILHMLLTGHPPKVREDGSYIVSKIRLNFVSPEAQSLVHQLMQQRPEDRPSAEEVARLPLLERSRQRLRAGSARLDAHLLDQMYAYASFPLLKKAALVAMVTRAETDRDFMPSIERFISFESNMKSGIDAEDIYRALSEELFLDMRKRVRKAVAWPQKSIGGSSAQRQSSCLPPQRFAEPAKTLTRARKKRCSIVSERFRKDLRMDVEHLIHKVDASGTGHIHYSEWLAATADPLWYTEPQRITAAFRLFDFDGDGMISEDDLKKVIPDVFKKFTVESVLQESQLSAKQTSWITFEHFSLLIRTQHASVFTLKRMVAGSDE